jgi:hypothetical protein
MKRNGIRKRYACDVYMTILSNADYPLIHRLLLAHRLLRLPSTDTWFIPDPSASVSPANNIRHRDRRGQFFQVRTLGWLCVN